MVFVVRWYCCCRPFWSMFVYCIHVYKNVSLRLRNVFVGSLTIYLHTFYFCSSFKLQWYFLLTSFENRVWMGFVCESKETRNNKICILLKDYVLDCSLKTLTKCSLIIERRLDRNSMSDLIMKYTRCHIC